MAEAKNRRLSINDRADIVHRLDTGDKQVNLAREYGISQSAISQIKRNRDQILTAKNRLEYENCEQKKKRICTNDNSLCNKSLYQWFTQMKSLNLPVFGKVLKEKAKLFNVLTNGSQDFQASNGWLDKWKKKYKIRHLSGQGEKASADENSNGAFCIAFQQFIKTHNYDPENVYNADESGLMWRALPQRTPGILKSEAGAAGAVPDDRLSLMFCGNASGAHKIPLMIIGAPKEPHCFKNSLQLPIVYKQQSDGWMDRQLFLEWYTEVFIPELEKRHGSESKNLLLLDRAPFHPSAEEINAQSDLCTVFYLPVNVTSSVQPMQQGVIQRTKRLFKRFLLEFFLLSNTEEENDKSLSKKWSLLHACNGIALAWSHIAERNMRNAWNNFLDVEEIPELGESLETDEFLEWIHEIRGYEEITPEQMISWLNDDNDPGWEVLSDEQLIQVAEGIFEQVMAFDDEDNDEATDNQPSSNGISPQEALTALTTAYQWLEAQTGCNADDLYTLDKLAASLRTLILKEIGRAQ